MTRDFKIETPKNKRVDKFLCLRNNAYAFKCNNSDESKNKIKRISRGLSKTIYFEEP